MSAYHASARIVGATPRLAGATLRGETPIAAPARAASEAMILVGDRVVGHGPNRLAERRSAIRERWSQLTFFLFDPNSWRS